MKPSIAQLMLLSLSVAFYAAGGAMSFARLWSVKDELRVAAKSCLYFGICACGGVILWHSIQRGAWQPLRDNFDSLLWLALLLSLFVMYIQRSRPIAGLEWFVMPIVILLLVAAGIFGRTDYHEYHTLVKDVWMWIHRVTAYGGAAAFAIAAVGGMMFVISSRRLRSKNKAAGPLFTSLERLERMMMVSVTLGFALLSVGLVTGLARLQDEKSEIPAAKLLLASFSWVVYAVVMHAPINPRFRGRRAAMLSVVGFILMIGTIVAVQFMPGGKD